MNPIKKALKKYNDISIVAKTTIWLMFCSVLQKCVSLITTPIFTRLMSTTQYGQFSVYNSWLQIFTIITTLRLNYAVFNKGMSKFKNNRDQYVCTMQTVTTITTTVVLLIYLIFRRPINKLTELPTYIMLAIFAELYVTPAIDFWTIRKRYEYIYKPVVARTLAMTFLNASLGVVAVLLTKEKGYARILTCVGVNLCFGCALYGYNLRKGKKLFTWEYAKFALLFNLPLLLHYISQYILDQFDRIMIQKMVGMAQAGIYSVAYNLGLIMKIVTQNLNNSMVPWEYDQLEKKEEKAIKRVDDTMFALFALVAVVALMFSAVAPELMKVFAAKKYYEAVYVVPPVAISMFFMFAYNSFANVEFFYERTKFTMYISMGGALLNIGLNYIFIKLFGYIAAAYTTLFCYIVFTVSHYIYMSICVKKLLGIRQVFNSIRLVLLSVVTLVGGVLVIFLYDKPIIRYAVILAACIVAFFMRNKIIALFKSIKKPKKA